MTCETFEELPTLLGTELDSPSAAASAPDKRTDKDLDVDSPEEPRRSSTPGQGRHRELWQRYFGSADAIIFVLDSTDGVRMVSSLSC